MAGKIKAKTIKTDCDPDVVFNHYLSTCCYRYCLLRSYNWRGCSDCHKDIRLINVVVSVLVGITSASTTQHGQISAATS